MNGNGLTNKQEIQELELSEESSKIEQEALERKIKLGKADEHLLYIINNCKLSGTKYLDLSKKNMSAIPEELLSLTHLEVSMVLRMLILLVMKNSFFQLNFEHVCPLY